MRKFLTSVIDRKTRHELILADCSYNMACDWLASELAKNNREIYRQEVSTNNELAYIWTGEWDNDKHDYKNKRMFYYDEERGYLMGE